MGTRPKFLIVVGVDNVVQMDPRRINRKAARNLEDKKFEFYSPEDKDSWFDDKDDIARGEIYGEEWETLDEVLYNVDQPGEYVCDRVVGLVVRDGEYDSPIFRALAAIDEKFMQAGVMRIPTLDPAKHRMAFKSYGYTQEDVKCNRFVESVFENMPSISRMLWARARFYLLQAGWDIPEEQLRYLLVWDWS